MKTKHFCRSILCLWYRWGLPDFSVQLSALVAITETIAVADWTAFAMQRFPCVSLKYLSQCIWHPLEKPGWHFFVLRQANFQMPKLSRHTEGPGRRMRLLQKRSDFFFKWPELASQRVTLQMLRKGICCLCTKLLETLHKSDWWTMEKIYYMLALLLC